MAYPQNSTIHRRRHENGDTDSICLHCFMTIASDREVERLRSQERSHWCDMFHLQPVASTFRRLTSSLRK
jgi:hypothetical protein